MDALPPIPASTRNIFSLCDPMFVDRNNYCWFFTHRSFRCYRDHLAIEWPLQSRPISPVLNCLWSPIMHTLAEHLGVEYRSRDSSATLPEFVACNDCAYQVENKIQSKWMCCRHVNVSSIQCGCERFVFVQNRLGGCDKKRIKGAITSAKPTRQRLRCKWIRPPHVEPLQNKYRSLPCCKNMPREKKRGNNRNFRREDDDDDYQSFMNYDAVFSPALGRPGGGCENHLLFEYHVKHAFGAVCFQ